MAYHEITIRISGQVQDTIIEKLMNAGCLGVMEQGESVIAYFPETLDINSVLNTLSLFKALLETTGRENEITYTHQVIPHQDWNESWKKSFQPLDIGETFTILPPWEEKRKGRINLIIDPGMAFGTGHHETTRSCLVLMEKRTDKSTAVSRKDATDAKNSSLGHESFLDLGTGTGVLAMAASKLGYGRIVAIDNDPLATEATEKNCALNSIANIEIKCGTLSDIDETFDVIAANLISGVLVELAPALFSHLKPGGIAFLSGILAEQGEEVSDAMRNAGLKLVEKYPDGKWVSLVVKK